MSTSRRRPRTAVLVAALLAVPAGLVADRSGALHGVEERTVAARFQLRAPDTPADIALVVVDDVTFDELEEQWPFRRTRHAAAVDALAKAGVREIVYDVQFTEQTTARADGALYEALGRAGGAVLATSESDGRGGTEVLGGDTNLAAIGARAASANLPDSNGGIVDRFPEATDRLASLAVTTARRVGAPVAPRTGFPPGGARIDFRGPPGTIDTFSFSALLDGRVPADRLRGRIVVVGAAAPSLGDVHVTPTADSPMSGPEIQANAIWTALRGNPLRDAPPALDVLLIVLLALLAPLLRLRLGVLATALAAPVLGLAFLVGAYVAFRHGTVVAVAAPLVALATASVATIVASHLAESAVRRRVSRDRDVLEQRVRARTVELRETQLEILQRLGRAAEWRDEDTGLHVTRMGELSRRLALAAGLSTGEAETLGHAAVAHDIGKIAIPDRILLKPGPLTESEQAEMQQHARIGASMLDGSRSQVMQLAEAIARTHHERWDGGGYPAGLHGEAIPLAGRICALCDVFDALVSDRPYKKGWPLERALAEIDALGGRHFDPRLAALFAPVARAAYGELYARTADPVAQPERDSAVGVH